MTAATNKWTYLVALALVWGSSFILIKRGLAGLSPYQLGALRMACAGIALLAIGYRKLPEIPSTKWKYIALTAMLGTFFPAFLFSVAQTQISSTVSSVLNALTPLNTLVIGVLVFSLDYRRNQIFGVLLGLAGSAMLILNGAMTHPEQNYAYALLIVLASMGYATNVNIIKRHLSDVSPLAISTGNFAVLLLPSLLVLGGTGFFEDLGRAEVQQASVYVVILGVIGTGLANIFFFRLIQMSSPVFATSVTYLIPVVAFFWGMLDGEFLTPVQFGGALIVLAGVYLSSRK